MIFSSAMRDQQELKHRVREDEREDGAFPSEDEGDLQVFGLVLDRHPDEKTTSSAGLA